MAGQNVLNHFEQPEDAAHEDNALVLGGTVKNASGSQNAAIADVLVGGSETTLANAVAINEILAALRATGIIAT